MPLFKRRQQLTAEDVEREIQVAIDAAWEIALRDPDVMVHWLQLFPDGQKPSQEEFIRRLAQELKDMEGSA